MDEVEWAPVIRLVLNELETTKRGGRIVRKNYRRRVVEKRTNHGLESEREVLLIMPEGCVRKGP